MTALLQRELLFILATTIGLILAVPDGEVNNLHDTCRYMLRKHMPSMASITQLQHSLCGVHKLALFIYTIYRCLQCGAKQASKCIVTPAEQLCGKQLILDIGCDQNK